MKFGILSTSHARKDYPCKHCKEAIKKGEKYAGQTFMGDPPFTVRVHTGCLFDWCEANEEARKRARIELAQDPLTGVPMPKLGRPPVIATMEQIRMRKQIQFYLHSCKEYLLRAYDKNDQSRIKASWQRYAKWLEQYADEDIVGTTVKYSFGEELNRTLIVKDPELRNKLILMEGNPGEISAMLHGIYGRKVERPHAEAPDNEDIARLMVEQELQHVTK